MNEKVLRTLEFDKIIQMLVEYASSEEGKKLCLDLKPDIDRSRIEEQQLHTKDAFNRLMAGGNISFSGIYNIRESLKRLEIGGTLNATELLRVLSILKVAKRAKSYGRTDRGDEIPDSLATLFDRIEPLSNLASEIERCIITETEIADDASPGLKSVRRNIHVLNDKIRSQMNSMLNSPAHRNHLQDNVITQRNGRYCLPVKAEAKGQIPGMIHDQSSSGSTFFIEPLAIVKMNNDLTELFIKEQEEIEIILANLSNQVGTQIDPMKTNLATLTQLDFIFAKGYLARELNGTMPMFNQDGIICIRQGRHPLLDKHKVVPIDIHLGDDFDSLIITGPNTGGKTVSLKTVGLLTLMGQAGLHIPAKDRSELVLFHEIFADIGDEQSIEQNLSTFSSHMTNIIRILENADEHSFVLFDELCAGTDPTEGAALAISILHDLYARKIKVMATTHYSEIKGYALTTPRVENACCEFSLETLSPTYRLLIGIPGKSNAFAISSKLGLPSFIIDDAKKRLDQEKESFEDILANLETSRVSIENTRLRIETQERELAAMKEAVAKKEASIDLKKSNLVQEASEEAHKILREAKELADETILNFQKYAQDAPTIKQMEEERAKIRQRMADAEKNISMKALKPQGTSKKPAKLRIGDTVTVHSLNLNGTVHTLPNNKGDFYVQMGILRSLVNINDVSLIDEKPVYQNKSKPRTGKVNLSKASSISSELNIIGKSVDEAIPILDKYLDDAYLSHLPSVRIVHGKGSGVLRKVVHEHLSRQKYVKSFHLGVYGEGDSGVTIVEFE